MIVKHDAFNKELERISQLLVEKGECKFDIEELKKSFFLQSSHTPDNIESIKFIDYGSVKKEYEPNVETFGVKIKDKNVLLGDIAYFMENDEIANIILSKFPELTIEEVEAAQRIMTTIMLGLECRKIE